jgi:hypothetical protein
MKSGAAQAQWFVELTDLAGLAPTLAGRLRVDGTLAGRPDDMAVHAEFHRRCRGRGGGKPGNSPGGSPRLPLRPNGSVEAGGTPRWAPLSLSATLARADDG